MAKKSLYKRSQNIKYKKCKMPPDMYPFYTIYPNHLEWYIETIKRLEERVKELEEIKDNA